ncbi:MAG: radical SAM protein [Chloroflexi bacterium]|nr:radical SAM protein [Chloroflexota bacterium]
MDAVFINPSPGGSGLNNATVIQPVGLAYMAAVLEKLGYRVAIIDADVLGLGDEAVLQLVPRDARLVGLYVNSYTFSTAKRLSAALRGRQPHSIVVAGGPLATAEPELVLRETGCCGVVRGEGEYAVSRIMENLSSGRPPFDSEVSGGCWYEGDGRTLMRNPIVRIQDLDALPFPAYHLLPPFTRYRRRSRKEPAAPIVTSRGCAHECIFCSKDVYERKVTFRSAANVLDEVDHLVRHCGIRQLDILDDNFMFSRARTHEILDGIIAGRYGIAVNIQTGIRTEILDEPMLDKMKRAGVYKLAFGIESADEEVLRTCRKRLDTAHAAQVVRMAKKKGFVVYGFFIIGLPGETEEAFERTLAYARELDFDVANFCMAIPFVGTELYRMVEREGRFLINTDGNIASGFYDGRAFYELGGNSEEVLVRRYRRAYREFYSLGKKLRLLMTIRSFSELRWFWDVGIMVLKGLLRKQPGG